MKQTIYRIISTAGTIKRKNLLLILHDEGFKCTDAEMREQVEQMVKEDGYLIASTTKGYKIITTFEDAERAAKYLKQKGIACIERASAIMESWNKNKSGEQIKLFV